MTTAPTELFRRHPAGPQCLALATRRLRRQRAAARRFRGAITPRKRTADSDPINFFQENCMFSHHALRSDAHLERKGASRAAGLPSLGLRRRGLLALALFAANSRVHSTTLTAVEVWKGPTCGCCGDWIKHLEANGFRVTAHPSGNGDVRARLGMPIRYGSCHTALIQGYAIEGHVPAREIRRLLREQPKAVGLAVPAMPVGSPGMDGPQYSGRVDAYDVLLVQPDGSAVVYQPYR
jgi:hypothetical protein